MNIASTKTLYIALLAMVGSLGAQLTTPPGNPLSSPTCGAVDPMDSSTQGLQRDASASADELAAVFASSQRSIAQQRMDALRAILASPYSQRCSGRPSVTPSSSASPGPLTSSFACSHLSPYAAVLRTPPPHAPTPVTPATEPPIDLVQEFKDRCRLPEDYVHVRIKLSTGDIVNFFDYYYAKALNEISKITRRNEKINLVEIMCTKLGTVHPAAIPQIILHVLSIPRITTDDRGWHHYNLLRNQFVTNFLRTLRQVADQNNPSTALTILEILQFESDPSRYPGKIIYSDREQARMRTGL